MHFRKLLLVVIAVAIVTFSVGLQGQGLIDGIKVNLPEAVTVGEKILPPGEYEIRRPSPANRDILQIFNKGKMVYETNVLTVATGPDMKDPKETKVVLHHIGDAFYFDKIWMEDKNYGWEFPLPERARALQRETMVYEKAPPSMALVAEVESGPGLAAQLDEIAAQQDREQAALDSERAEHERQEQLERQARLDREREEADRNRVAALQPEPEPVTPTREERVEEAVTEPQPSIQNNSEIPEQLPETATNWLALVMSGIALLTVSFIVRPARAQG